MKLYRLMHKMEHFNCEFDFYSKVDDCDKVNFT